MLNLDSNETKYEHKTLKILTKRQNKGRDGCCIKTKLLFFIAQKEPKTVSKIIQFV